MINEKKLNKLILKSNFRNVVNVHDDYIEYTNGYFAAKVEYTNWSVISKLCSVGAIKNLKTFEVSQSIDLTNIFKPKGEEIEVTKTEFLTTYKGDYVNIFNISGKLYGYEKNYVDVFDDVIYKVEKDDKGKVPFLRMYTQSGDFIGAVCGIYFEFLDKRVKDLLKSVNEVAEL